MKTNKKGVSLIVLVITIIVIIILAAAVILTINNNNPMDNANKARYSQDRATMQEAFSTAVGTVLGEELASPIFYSDAACTTKISAYTAITDGTIYFMAGTQKGNIKFATSGEDKANHLYIVGTTLPTYGTSAGTATWAINAAGDLQLTINGKIYNGSQSGT